jgi:hypothetical protein
VLAPAPQEAFQTARLPVLIFEPGSPIRMRFAPSPHDLLNDRETLVTIVANCVVVLICFNDTCLPQILELRAFVHVGYSCAAKVFGVRASRSEDAKMLNSL